MIEVGKAYFKRRATEELIAASASYDERARIAHPEMAERYNDLLFAVGANDEHIRTTLDQAA